MSNRYTDVRSPRNEPSGAPASRRTAEPAGKERAQAQPGAGAGAQAAPAEEQPIPVNGFRQVLEMLKIADQQFRDSLLRRLAHKDPELARNLRRELANWID